MDPHRCDGDDDGGGGLRRPPGHPRVGEVPGVSPQRAPLPERYRGGPPGRAQVGAAATVLLAQGRVPAGRLRRALGHPAVGQGGSGAALERRDVPGRGGGGSPGGSPLGERERVSLGLTHVRVGGVGGSSRTAAVGEGGRLPLERWGIARRGDERKFLDAQVSEPFLQIVLLGSACVLRLYVAASYFAGVAQGWRPTHR